jgi:hypothetical protein
VARWISTCGRRVSSSPALPSPSASRKTNPLIAAVAVRGAMGVAVAGKVVEAGCNGAGVGVVGRGSCVGVPVAGSTVGVGEAVGEAVAAALVGATVGLGVGVEGAGVGVGAASVLAGTARAAKAGSRVQLTQVGIGDSRVAPT